MPRLHWMTKLIAIAFVFVPFNLWVWDNVSSEAQGKGGMIFALFWVPPVLLAIITILLWESACDRWLVRMMSRVSFVCAWVNLVFTTAFLLFIFEKDTLFSLPDFVDDPLTLFSIFYVVVLLPAALTFIPVHVLYLWGDSRRRTVLSITAPFVLIASWFVMSQRSEAFLRSYHDPCYEVVEGKITSSYDVKGDRVCVLYYETVFGESFFKTLEGADVGSFEVVGYSYGKDRYHVYDGEKIYDSVDVGTFRHVGGGYYTDRDHVYYYEKAVDGVHPESFRMLDSRYDCGTDGTVTVCDGKIKE